MIGIVLAGGRSRRFGGDKLGLEIGGRPMLERVIEIVGQVSTRVIVALAPDDGRLIQVEAVTTLVVHDPVPDGGPLVGLSAALAAVAGRSQERAIVAPGDTPWLRPDLLKALLDRLAPPGVTAVLPVVDGVPQPLPCAVDVSAGATAAAATLAADQRSLTDWLRRLEVAHLAEADRRVVDPDGWSFRDIDLPSDIPG